MSKDYRIRLDPTQPSFGTETHRLPAATDFLTPPLLVGEQYAGIIRGLSGEKGYHLILRPDTAEGLTWEEAELWAECSGGELPTMREALLLCANNTNIPPVMHWTNTEDTEHSFKCHYGFVGGRGRCISHTDTSQLRAVSVRRAELDYSDIDCSANHNSDRTADNPDHITENYKVLAEWFAGQCRQELQVELGAESWVPADRVTLLPSFNKYRLKPATITVNGVEVPEPVRMPLQEDQPYYVVSTSRSDGWADYNWHGDVHDFRWLFSGLIHLTKDAAHRHFEAIIAPSKKEPS